MTPGSVLLLVQPTSGGVARHVEDLAEELVRRGWQVHVGCPGESRLASRSAAAGATVHPVGFVRPVSLFGDARAFLETRRLIRRLGCDIVHCHSSKAGFIGRLACRTLGMKRTVYTPHCLAFVGDPTSLKGRFYRLAERLAGPWTGRWMAVSDAEARQIVDNGLGSKEGVRRVHNGIGDVTRPDAAFAMKGRASFGLDPGTGGCVFMTVGRADRQKAFDVFVDAAILAAPRAPEARFVLVGGDYTHAGELERLRRRADVTNAKGAVYFAGEVEGVTDMLSVADVLVLPSRWESLPYVLLEAGAMGLPVLATPVGGVPELVEEDVTGMLVPVDDAGALADAMVRLAADPSKRRTMGDAMAELVRPMTVDAMVQGVVEIYDEILPA
jgi:glycosyltransferase involved in cell wall biosynthesis